MYDRILPHPNNKHNLVEYPSKRGESKLESFHDRFANFSNFGMRDTLANNLNFCGTARYNRAIRHGRSLIVVPPGQEKNLKTPSEEQRKKIPGAWEKVVPYPNHCEIFYVNRLAEDIGLEAPLKDAEPFPSDTGEHLFSEFLTIEKPHLSLCLSVVLVSVSP